MNYILKPQTQTEIDFKEYMVRTRSNLSNKIEIDDSDEEVELENVEVVSRKPRKRQKKGIYKSSDRIG